MAEEAAQPSPSSNKQNPRFPLAPGGVREDIIPYLRDSNSSSSSSSSSSDDNGVNDWWKDKRSAPGVSLIGGGGVSALVHVGPAEPVSRGESQNLQTGGNGGKPEGKGGKTGGKGGTETGETPTEEGETPAETLPSQSPEPSLGPGPGPGPSPGPGGKLPDEMVLGRLPQHILKAILEGKPLEQAWNEALQQGVMEGLGLTPVQINDYLVSNIGAQSIGKFGDSDYSVRIATDIQGTNVIPVYLGGRELVVPVSKSSEFSTIYTIERADGRSIDIPLIKGQDGTLYIPIGGDRESVFVPVIEKNGVLVAVISDEKGDERYVVISDAEFRDGKLVLYSYDGRKISYQAGRVVVEGGADSYRFIHVKDGGKTINKIVAGNVSYTINPVDNGIVFVPESKNVKPVFMPLTPVVVVDGKVVPANQAPSGNQTAMGYVIGMGGDNQQSIFITNTGEAYFVNKSGDTYVIGKRVDGQVDLKELISAIDVEELIKAASSAIRGAEQYINAYRKIAEAYRSIGWAAPSMINPYGAPNTNKTDVQQVVHVHIDKYGNVRTEDEGEEGRERPSSSDTSERTVGLYGVGEPFGASKGIESLTKTLAERLVQLRMLRDRYERNLSELEKKNMPQKQKEKLKETYRNRMKMFENRYRQVLKGLERRGINTKEIEDAIKDSLGRNISGRTPHELRDRYTVAIEKVAEKIGENGGLNDVKAFEYLRNNDIALNTAIKDSIGRENIYEAAKQIATVSGIIVEEGNSYSLNTGSISLEGMNKKTRERLKHLYRGVIDSKRREYERKMKERKDVKPKSDEELLEEALKEDFEYVVKALNDQKAGEGYVLSPEFLRAMRALYVINPEVAKSYKPEIREASRAYGAMRMMGSMGGSTDIYGQRMPHNHLYDNMFERTNRYAVLIEQ